MASAGLMFRWIILDVGVGQCLGNAADDAQRLPPLEAPARREAIGQRLPVEVLEGHEEEAALGVATDVVTTTIPGWERRAAARASAWKCRS